MTTEGSSTTRKRLDSWKQIAEYLGRDVRTAMRWEQNLGLPVHRVPGGQRGGVFALVEEIDGWLEARKDQVAESVLDSTTQPRRFIAIRVYPLLFCSFVIIGLAAWLLFIRSNRNAATEVLTLKLQDKTFKFVANGEIVLRSGGIGMMAAADLNHDGWDDLVIGGSPGNEMLVLLNQGGTFRPPVLYRGCNSSVGPAVGDFDGDGNPDIAVACFDSHTVQVWWGDGKGGFHSPLTLEVGMEPKRCAVGDFNRDGIADLVVDAGGGGRVTVFGGHRDRTFTRTTWEAGANPHIPFVVDLDGDGILDIVFGCATAAGNYVTILRGVGDGSFRPPEKFFGVSNVWTVLAADFTGDKIPDMFAASIDGRTSFFVGLGSGNFLPAKPPPKSVSADVPTIFSSQGRDYILDLQLYPAQLRMLSFDAEGNAAVSNSVPVDGIPKTVLTADFNHDGRQELAIMSIEGDLSKVTIYAQK